MFDIGASELLLTVIVAIVVIGPKDLPRALRMAGGWLAKIRRVSGHFRSGIEEMIRQAEMEEMEKKWAEKNAAIMQQEAGAEPGPESGAGHDFSADYPTEPALPAPHSVPPHDELPRADGLSRTRPVEALGQAARPEPANLTSPELPLAPPKAQP
ncbi:MAG: twin-arginine translocation protein TatB [Novosphingobium sp.]|nr:twin-arginine translocation protein TatB [Novosphingobium sp.]